MHSDFDAYSNLHSKSSSLSVTVSDSPREKKIITQLGKRKALFTSTVSKPSMQGLITKKFEELLLEFEL